MKKMIHSGPILMKLYQPVLGSGFFLKHSVYSIFISPISSYKLQQKMSSVKIVLIQTDRTRWRLFACDTDNMLYQPEKL